MSGGDTDPRGRAIHQLELSEYPPEPQSGGGDQDGAQSPVVARLLGRPGGPKSVAHRVAEGCPKTRTTPTRSRRSLGNFRGCRISPCARSPQCWSQPWLPRSARTSWVSKSNISTISSLRMAPLRHLGSSFSTRIASIVRIGIFFRCCTSLPDSKPLTWQKTPVKYTDHRNSRCYAS